MICNLGDSNKTSQDLLNAAVQIDTDVADVSNFINALKEGSVPDIVLEETFANLVTALDDEEFDDNQIGPVVNLLTILNNLQ